MQNGAKHCDHNDVYHRFSEKSLRCLVKLRVDSCNRETKRNSNQGNDEPCVSGNPVLKKKLQRAILDKAEGDQFIVHFNFQF